MVIYSYFYYKIFKIYKYVIKQLSSNEETPIYATLAFSCLIFYLTMFIVVFLNKLYDIPISSKSIRIIAIIGGFLIFALNYYLFNYKDKYKAILEYFEKKGTKTTSIIGYFALLLFVVVLIYFGTKVFMMGRPGADWQIHK